jgi:putative oxidoreductase
MKFLTKYTEQIYALMRIVIGLLFFAHGFQKASAMLNGTMPTNDIMLTLAAIIEFVAGILVTIGWNTRLAAFIASGEMAVAYFKAHLPAGLLPINNHGELALVYCFVFFFIAAYGSGIWSVDKLKR